MSDTEWAAAAIAVLALVVGWLAWEMRAGRTEREKADATRTSVPPRSTSEPIVGRRVPRRRR